MANKEFNVKLATLKIAAVERAFDVNSVTVGGMKIWPLVRVILYFQLAWGRKDPASDGFVRFDFLKYDKTFRDLPKSISKTEILWMTIPEYYTDKIFGKYFCRFEDPFIELFDKGNISKVEFNSELTAEKNPRVHKPYYLSPVITLLGAPIEKLPEIDNFEGLAAAVKNICGARLSRQQILGMALSIVSYTEYFLDLLQAIKPKVVFLACYYSVRNMGLVRACNFLGIPTVEYQHGKQGKFHSMYTHWSAIPPRGYELLPRYFWSWGEESANNISRWMGSDGAYHKALVGGSPWLYLWVNNIWPEDTGVVRDFEKSFADKKTILVCLQAFDELLSEAIVSAMRNSPQGWVWLLRLPPVHRSREAELVDIMKNNGITNYDLDISNRASLYTLLKRVDQHVTYFSSVCYEALAFGINTIVIHAMARDLYSEYIEAGYFVYAATGEELLSSLKEKMAGDFVPEETPYLVTDIKKARKIVGFLLSKSLPDATESVR